MASPLLQSLIALLAPPREPVGDPSDWDAVAEAWGTGFPADYHEFLAVYGAGSIDNHIWVATPADHEDRGVLTVRRRTPTSMRTARLRAEWPYPLWPQSGALLGWRATADVIDLYWDTSAPDPDLWTVVSHSHEGDFIQHGCGMVEFLCRMLGPRGERPLESPTLYGAPNSRFLGPVEERLLKKAGTDPWEYLEELYQANEAADELSEGGLVVVQPDGTMTVFPGVTTPPESCEIQPPPVPRPDPEPGRGLSELWLSPERIAALSAPSAPTLSVLGLHEGDGDGVVLMTVVIELGVEGAADLTLPASLRVEVTVVGPGMRSHSATVDPVPVLGAGGAPAAMVVREDMPLVLEVPVPWPLLPVRLDGQRVGPGTSSGLTFAAEITDPAIEEFRAAHGIPAEPKSEDILLGTWTSP